MTDNGTISPSEVEQSYRKMRRWGIAAVSGAIIFVLLAGYTYISNAGQNAQILSGQQKLSQQYEVIAKQNNVIGQVCKVAGGQVDNNAEAREYCSRVESGLPAVPIAATTPPTGVQYTRTDGPCHVVVGLTNGTTNRLGPFCGADGSVGPTGPTGESGEPGNRGRPGPTGASGVPGAAGVGIRTVSTSTDRCYVDLTLTDGTARTLGPFCGPPLGEFTITEDGGRKHCTRQGGSDASPNYTCAVDSEPTDTSEPPASTVATTAGVPLLGTR